MSSAQKRKSPAATGLNRNDYQRANHTTSRPESAFLDAMQAALGPVDFAPVADGQIHRFRCGSDRVGTRNGWYVLHVDGIPSGAFGSWKTGESHTWCSRTPADPLEAQLIARRVMEAKRQREIEQKQRQQSAAERARKLWRDSSDADHDHPYLVAKAVQPHSLRQLGALLLVPLYLGGQLANLQTISADGSKRFLAGGRVRGAYSPFGRVVSDRPLLICEGWATAATLHEQTGHPVAAAMNAGNLPAVAEALADRNPGVQLVVCGDDDRLTEGNPGRVAAMAAATKVGCQVAFPEWPAGAPESLTDFNDLWIWRADHG